MADAILAVLVFGPALITYSLKSNAALAFLAVCGSFMLITLAGADLRELTGRLDLQVDSSTLNLALLLLPLLITLLITRKRSSSGQIRSLLQLVTAVCAGGLLALVSVPLVNVTLAPEFADSWGWDKLQNLQTAIIGIGLALSLLLIWFSHTKRGKH